ncbi:MAG: hypothetical protein EBS37_16530 [Betaproteobacteria bacterium]|nr:hypothetical protein [Betaproteobacteria bacterium]
MSFGVDWSDYGHAGTSTADGRTNDKSFTLSWSGQQTSDAQSYYEMLMPGGGTVRARFDAGQGKSFQATHKLSLRQRDALAARLQKEGKSLDAVLNAAFADDVKAQLKPAGEFENAAAIFAAKKDREVSAKLQEQFSQRVEALLKH